MHEVLWVWIKNGGEIAEISIINALLLQEVITGEEFTEVVVKEL